MTYLEDVPTVSVPDIYQSGEIGWKQKRFEMVIVEHDKMSIGKNSTLCDL